MFGNRFLAGKILVALGLFLALCALCDRLGENINPAYRRCLLEPKKYHGTELWIPWANVAQVSENRMVLTDGLIPVLGTIPKDVRVNDAIALRATFQKNGTLQLIVLKKNTVQGNLRPWVNALSALALILVLVLFLRAFRIRWDRLTLRRRDG